MGLPERYYSRGGLICRVPYKTGPRGGVGPKARIQLLRPDLRFPTRQNAPMTMLIRQLRKRLTHLTSERPDQRIQRLWLRHLNGHVRTAGTSQDQNAAQFNHARPRAHVRDRLKVLGEHASAAVTVPCVVWVHRWPRSGKSRRVARPVLGRQNNAMTMPNAMSATALSISNRSSMTPPPQLRAR
jgi:hypothetical protein